MLDCAATARSDNLRFHAYFVAHPCAVFVIETSLMNSTEVPIDHSTAVAFCVAKLCSMQGPEQVARR